MKKKLIDREILPQIEKKLKLREYLAVVGPRQSGKTTLLEIIKAKHSEAVYLTFEDKKVLRLFEEDIDRFIKFYCQDKKLLLLDEFQYASEGGKNLKFIFDTQPALKIILTGSSSSDIRAKVGKYMVGRILFLNLWPLSWLEFLMARDKKLAKAYLQEKFNFHRRPKVKKTPQRDSLVDYFLALLEEYLLFGGYPRVVKAATDEEKKTVLNGIFSTYLLRDVVGFAKIEKETAYQKLVTGLGLQIGNLYQYRELGNLTRLSYAEVVSYLEVLKQTFIIRGILPFYTNPRTELVKTAKVYFYDLGLRNSLLENFLPLEQRQDAGALAENFAVNQLAGQFSKINFWRTKSKAEVDFVIRHQGETIPLEVKFQSGEVAVSKSFYSFIQKYQPPFGIILTREAKAVRKVNSTPVYFYPLYLL